MARLQLWNTVPTASRAFRDSDESCMACGADQWFDRTAYDRQVLMVVVRISATKLTKKCVPSSGAISDASTSKYRRRYWVVLSTLVLVISTITLAYCQSIAAFLVDILGGGAGSWDPKWTKSVS